MRNSVLLCLVLVGCAGTQDLGSALLDSSVIGPRLAAARESRLLTEERVSVSAHWLTPNALEVSGEGTAATPADLLEEHIALKAAATAIEAGYRYVAPTAYQDTSALADYTVNAPYETKIVGDTRGSLVGNNYRGTTTATAVTTGGPRSGRVLLPRRIVTFEVFDSPPERLRTGQYFDAIALYNDLGRKHIDNFQTLETP